MTIEKTTKYICNRCFKTLTYKELTKEKTITINTNETKYAHNCPICRSNVFRLISTIIKS